MAIGCLPENFKLHGKNFILNIQLPGIMDGIITVNRDPRKLRIKPQAYAGLVEKVGDGCTKVKPGDRVIVERFSWIQINVDDERIIASEKDLLILGNGVPNNGIGVIDIIEDQKPVSATLNTDAIAVPTKEYIFGSICACSSNVFKKGDLAWIAKSDRDQWNIGSTKFAFREDESFLLVKAEP